MIKTFKLDLLSQNKKSPVVVVSHYSDYNQNPLTTGPDIIVDMQTIKQSLDNLFHCRKYQRRYMYDYYVPIESLIGELYGPNGAYIVLTDIASYVEYNEPRVRCYPKLSQISANEPNLVRLDLVHSVQGMGTGEKYTYSTQIPILSN